MTKSDKVRPIESDQLVILKNAVAMAKYDLSRNQQKVFLEVAVLAKNNPQEKFYKLYIREFLKNINVSTNDTAELKREIEEMRNITIHIPKTKRGGELKANFFASVEIFENQTSRYIEIELSEKLKPYFIEIAEGDFFHYQIENTRVLKSNHSIRMYLYLKAWRWTGKALIRYSELRSILGVKEGDYKLFGDFKKRVLDKAQEELKDKTDVSFDYTLIRERANNPNTPVHKIAFTIHENGKTPAIIEEQKAPQIVIPLTVEPDSELVQLAQQIEPINLTELGGMIAIYGRERVHDVLTVAMEQTSKGIKISSLIGFIHTAIKNGSGQGRATAQVKKKQQAQALLDHKAIETAINKGLDDFKAHHFTQMGKDAPQQVKDSFFAQVQDEIRRIPALKSVYQINDVWNPQVLAQNLGAKMNELSDDQLAVAYMESIGTPIDKVKGFWQYQSIT